MTCSSCNRPYHCRKPGAGSAGCRKTPQNTRWAAASAGCAGRTACASTRAGCSASRTAGAPLTRGGYSLLRPYPGYDFCPPADPCRSHDPCRRPMPCRPPENGCLCPPDPADCYPYCCSAPGPGFGCGDGCGCDPCADPCADSCTVCCSAPVYGYFTQVGSLNVAAGGVIPFNGGSTVEGIWKDGGTFTLEEEGVYLATLTARSPADTALSTELSVRVNGIVNPGGTITFASEATDPPQSASAQTVLTVNSGAVVTVTSSEALTLTPENVTDPLVTLTLIKIG